jgi:hypothetical protein
VTDPYATYVPPAPPPYKVGAAVTWAWYMFRKHWKVFVVGMIPIVLVTLVYLVAFLAIYFPFLGRLSNDTPSDDDGLEFFRQMAILYGVLVVVTIPMFVLYANLLRAALIAADGGTPTYRMLWSTRRAGRIMATGLALTVAGLIGTLMCLVPGLALAVFGVFTVAFIVDKDLSMWAAFKASCSLVKANFGLVLLTLLAIFGVSYACSLVPVVGAAAGVPLALLILAYAYRSLVPATPQP